MPQADPGEFCRELEAYLCRKNDGHLVRIVGPAFELVCGWAEQGIPFKVACQGVDRCFDRYHAKQRKRRPLRIEFCEADVLDAFDDWRRAVGVARGADGAPEAPASQPSLPAHLQRVLQKLTTARSLAGDERVVHAIDQAIDALESQRAGAARLRGEARTNAIERLASIERELLDSLREAAAPRALAELQREAEGELAGFASRMPADARRSAVAAAVDRLLRERAGVPRIRYD